MSSGLSLLYQASFERSLENYHRYHFPIRIDHVKSCATQESASALINKSKPPLMFFITAIALEDHAGSGPMGTRSLSSM